MHQLDVIVMQKMICLKLHRSLIQRCRPHPPMQKKDGSVRSHLLLGINQPKKIVSRSLRSRTLLVNRHILHLSRRISRSQIFLMKLFKVIMGN